MLARFPPIGLISMAYKVRHSNEEPITLARASLWVKERTAPVITTDDFVDSQMNTRSQHKV